MKPSSVRCVRRCLRSRGRHVRPARPRLDVASVPAQQLPAERAGPDRDAALARPDARALAAAAQRRPLRPRRGRRGRAAAGRDGRGRRAPAAASPAQRAEAAARRERRRAARRAQREAVQTCERQFAEATHACRQVFDLVGSEPHKARAQCEALTRALARQDAGRRARPVAPPAERRRGRQGGDARHQRRLISLLMGRVFGMSASDMLDLGVGALLHDVGKPELPVRLRHRDEHFTPSRAAVLRGARRRTASPPAAAWACAPGALLVIAPAPRACRRLRLSAASSAATGMTLAARIVALVNRYDNLCNPPFRPRR